MRAQYPIFFTLPLLSYLAYTFYKHLEDPFYMSLIDRVDFFIHEFGHLFFMIFWNQFLMVAGGTLMQLIIPFLTLLLFFRQRDFFALAFCLTWIGTNFFYISMYSGDAMRLDLSLIGFGRGETIHDWNYLFWETGLILHTSLISNIFYGTAIVFYILWLVFGIYLIISRLLSSKLDKY